MKSISDKELVYMLREPATGREGFSAMVQQYSEQLYWEAFAISYSLMKTPMMFCRMYF